MTVHDAAPSRLAVAKRAAWETVSASPGDRVGLLVFGGSAFLQLPLTSDQAALRLFLDAATPTIWAIPRPTSSAALDHRPRASSSTRASGAIGPSWSCPTARVAKATWRTPPASSASAGFRCSRVGMGTARRRTGAGRQQRGAGEVPSRPHRADRGLPAGRGRPPGRRARERRDVRALGPRAASCGGSRPALDAVPAAGAFRAEGAGAGRPVPVAAGAGGDVADVGEVMGRGARGRGGAGRRGTEAVLRRQDPSLRSG